MISTSMGAAGVIAVAIAAVAIPVVAIWLLGTVLRVVFRVLGAVFGFLGAGLGRIGTFVRAEVTDSLQLGGGVLTGAVLAPLALGNLAIGRRRSARHFGRALEDELMSSALSLYRLALGNPARLLGLGALTDGLERRLPDVVARAPEELVPLAPTKRRTTRGRGGLPSIEGYTVTGELPAGGSGARLLLAQPANATLARYRDAGHPDPGQVVIKSFALVHGSTLPQIVRESRALEAARRLGLVLDHELTEESFWYAMPFVPGDDLDVVTRRMHAQAGPEGLGRRSVHKVVGFASDLLATLDRFHREGLWHKDIKPSNLIVSGDRVHLVDLGLVTPLASAMTLTTHGTEYYRDPELVRMAMQGVKVHEVDGVKFDLYSAGAVLYSMVENSFPAHGSLSRFTKRCPDALAFVVRRAMAEIDQRYGSAEEMARDVDALLAAPDAFALRPADLPSMGGPAVRPSPLARRASFARHEPRTRIDLEELVGTGARRSKAGAPPPLEPLPPIPPTAGTARRRRRRGTLKALACAALALVFVNGVLVSAHMKSRAEARSVAHRQSLHDRAVLAMPGHRVEVQPPLLSLPTGTVLLVQDLGLGRYRDKVWEFRETLMDHGARIVDEHSPDRAAVELLAGARRALELAPHGDRDATERLRAFLARHPELDEVLWLGEGDGKVRYKRVRRIQ